MISSSTRSHSQEIIIGTFNVRLDKEADIGNLWIDRLPIIANLIRFHQFDVLGTQEGMKHQLEQMINLLPEYARYGLDRGGFGGHSAIFYKKEKYKLLLGGDFWLSETSEVPSIGCDACSNRMVSWVKLQELETNKTFFVFNTHFDSKGQMAREESSKMVLNEVKKIAGTSPVIFTGDFNSSMSSKSYQILRDSGILKNSFELASHPYVNNGSTNGFGKSIGRRIIDHIFITEHFSVNRWGILTDSYYSKYPSDHFPVLTSVTLR